MTDQHKPTISDVYKAIGFIKQDVGGIKADVQSIHEQTKKTNGRVTALESKENARSAVENYIAKEGIKTPQEENEGNNKLVKQLFAIIGVLTAMIVGLMALIGTGKLP
jgi:hypothetical protein